MKSIEEIKLNELNKKGLENVTFLPHRFGSFFLATFLSGYGLCLIFSNIWLGLFITLVNAFLLLYFYAKRETI